MSAHAAGARSAGALSAGALAAGALAAGAAPLAAYDGRPFFERALAFGVAQGVLDAARVDVLVDELARGMVQIANYFGTAHLRPELELALTRMVRLISLYLEVRSGSDLHAAAIALRDATLQSHSRGGSDLLKQLFALPDSTLALPNPVTADAQRSYLDAKTGAQAITLADYRAELAQRSANQVAIDAAFWLAQQLGSTREDVEDTDALVRSAMLVLFAAKKTALKLPTRTAFVALVDAARRPRAKLDSARFAAFVASAPAAIAAYLDTAMRAFIANDLPAIRAAECDADQLLHVESLRPFFIRTDLDEDAGAYDRLVAKTWHRVTRGETDDPQVLATVLLRLASGLPPAPGLLLKDAREVVRVFRERGFDHAAVTQYLQANAPSSQREALEHFWTRELAPEAETRLADVDPNWPDRYQERALAYLREVCRASWKPRRN